MKVNGYVIFTQHFFGLVAGQLLCEWAEVEKRVIGAQNDNHAGSGFYEGAEGGFGAFLCPR